MFIGQLHVLTKYETYLDEFLYCRLYLYYTTQPGVSAYVLVLIKVSTINY